MVGLKKLRFRPGKVRKINRQMLMELHGAKDYFDCSKAIKVTDGEKDFQMYQHETNIVL